MSFFIFVALIGLIPAVIASKKGRSFGKWWFFGALLFIVALPMAIFMKPLPPYAMESTDKSNDNNVPGWLVLVVLLCIGAFIYNQANDNSPAVSQPNEALASPSIPASPVEQPKIPNWFYHQSEDKMATGTTYQAINTSTNTVNFQFPYSGEQHARLTLRKHPRLGSDVILRIEKGQFLCSSYDGCNVLVRFDEEKATNFSAVGASDNSTESIFIQNYKSFYEKLQKSNRVRISAEIYQEGSPVFEFNVSEFDSKKYLPK